jgi:hypothetical protein
MSSGDIGSEEGELTEDMAGFEVKHEHYSCVVGKKNPPTDDAEGGLWGRLLERLLGY